MKNRLPSGPSASPTGPRQGRETFTLRIKHDIFLFGLCLLFLAFTTWALSVTWWLMRDPVLLLFAIGSLLPAFYLIYLRERPAATR